MRKGRKRAQTVSKSARQIAPILGIKLTSTSRLGALKEVLSQARRTASKKGNASPFFLVTPNPEIVLRAQNDKELAEILNSADLVLPDGRGLAWAVRNLTGEKIGVVPGRALFADLVAEAGKRGWRVFLLGGKKGVVERAAKRLSAIYHLAFTIFHFDSGPWLDEDGQPVGAKNRKIEEQIIKKINKFQPHFLFVGFGAPKQEKWLARNLSRVHAGVAMTVGGTLDYYAGRVPLPPKVFEKLGLEWLWRLITQPQRAPRIFRAVIVFPFKVIWHKLTH